MENFEAEQLPPPPEAIILDNTPSNQESVSLILPEHQQIVADNLDRLKKSKTENLKSPEEILVQLAQYSKDYTLAPVEAFANGDFDDPNSKLVLEDGCVVLVRHASDSEHLIKSGRNASPEEMMDSSLSQAGAPEAGAIHTSAKVDNISYAYSRYPLYGEFRIPVTEFLDLAKEHKIILGNIGECEVILSGDIAQKYLTKIVEK